MDTRFCTNCGERGHGYWECPTRPHEPQAPDPRLHGRTYQPYQAPQYGDKASDREWAERIRQEHGWDGPATERPAVNLALEQAEASRAERLAQLEQDESADGLRN